MMACPVAELPSAFGCNYLTAGSVRRKVDEDWSLGPSLALVPVIAKHLPS